MAALAALWSEVQELPAPRLPTKGLAVQRTAWAAWAVALLVLLGAVYPRDMRLGQWQQRLSFQENFPSAAARMMKEGSWPGKLYNDYVWGGYLIWELWPKRKVFIDGRAEVYYPTGAFDSEMRIHTAGAGFESELDRWEIDVVLTRKNGSLANAMARLPSWRKAFYGAIEEVYVRKGSPADERRAG
jgi:hypothetical protein